MKKILMILTMAGMTSMAAAQGYVRIDTLYKPYFDFDYEAWISDSTHPLVTVRNIDSRPLYRLPEGYAVLPYPADRMEYNYIEGETDIYGIAVWGFPAYFFRPMSFSYVEYLLLYDATPDSLVELAQVLFNQFDSVAYKGAHNLPTQHANPAQYCDDHHIRSMTTDMLRWDFLFDKPIHVSDSFYVGHTCNNVAQFRIDWEIVPYTPMWWGTMSTDRAYVANSFELFYDSSCWMPTRNCKVRFTRPQDSTTLGILGINMNEWRDYETHEFHLTVPLLRVFDTVWTVDTPACYQPYNLGIMSRFGDTVTLRWEHDGSHEEWQLSYGPVGTNPEDGTLVTCHTNRWRFKDTINVPMTAFVRTVCRELDTIRYSPWCDPIEWFVQPSVIPTSEGEDELSALISVAPNPASCMVTVSSRCLMEGIEVYSVSGSRIKASTARTHSISFPVNDWPHGVYLVVVYTPKGTICKRFIVGD